ncbi:EscU/YscU/HrcU family type III secretion system export apparatus switch protein, partial [Citrobacter freundii]|nr:EscU/YscU/HrcU family type III secretion system export apparatus switch protein [Citrobacter freundii]
LARRIFKTAKIYTFIDSSSIDEIMRLLTWLEQMEQAWKDDIPQNDESEKMEGDVNCDKENTETNMEGGGNAS